MKLHKLTINKIHNGLIEKEFSAVELTKLFLDRIDNLDKKIFSFLTLTEDLAIKQAEKVDDLIFQKKEIPILAGVPMAIKDNILIKDIKCTAGSKILKDYIAPYNATVIQKLKELGVVFLGKTNMDEFAMGSSCENSGFFPTKNPCDLERVPGGSSGGSAAAVAAEMCVSALGSDTGGSIRLPASFCGVVGLKPTYGAVSRNGLIAMASSLDQIGTLTKCVEDAQIVFEAIKGKDQLDSTSVEYKSKYKTQNTKINELRIGIPKEYFIKGIDPEVEKVIKKAIEKYEKIGAKIEEISLPHTEYALASYYIIMPSEVSSNLARYDSVRYGGTREEFGKEVRRRIMLGTYTLSAGYYEAYYLRAQKVRTLIKQDFDKAFKKVDVILTPISPTPAFKLGEKITNPLTMYLSDILTVSVNLAGLPAISIPCGKVENLPVGLQIIGNFFEEDKILEISQLFEKTTL